MTEPVIDTNTNGSAIDNLINANVSATEGSAPAPAPAAEEVSLVADEAEVRVATVRRRAQRLAAPYAAVFALDTTADGAALAHHINAEWGISTQHGIVASAKKMGMGRKKESGLADYIYYPDQLVTDEDQLNWEASIIEIGTCLEGCESFVRTPTSGDFAILIGIGSKVRRLRRRVATRR